MRRVFGIASLLVAAVLLSACVMMPPAPKSIEVSEARLAQLIGSQFPFNSEMLDVLDVGVSAPRITLDPANNRINTAMDLNVAGSGLVGLVTSREYQGGLDLSYGLRFEPADGTVRMSDVRVHRLSVIGAPPALQRPIEKLGASLAKRLLKDYVLYRLSAEDLHASEGWAYKPGAVRVAPTGLSISLDPVARK